MSTSFALHLRQMLNARVNQVLATYFTIGFTSEGKDFHFLLLQENYYLDMSVPGPLYKNIRDSFEADSIVVGNGVRCLGDFIIMHVLSIQNINSTKFAISFMVKSC